MPPTALREANPDRTFTWLLALGLPLLAALLLGGDSSWDLRNYHLYDVHAWWTGRAAIDIAPAQQQTWHNPTLDVPLYLLARAGAPARVLTAWLLLPAVLLLWSLSRLHALLSEQRPTRLAQAVLACLALSGAGIGGTLGLSTNDVFVAAAMTFALSLALAGPSPATLRNWVLAGLVAGMAAGLKLSAAYACVALACTVLPGASWEMRGKRLAALAAGGALGALLTYGWWGWHLHSTYANPFFPYFNDLFRSDAAMPVSHADLRFRPPTLLDGVLAPFRLLQTSALYSELRMRDPRVLAAVLGMAWLCWRSARGPAGLHARRQAIFLFVLAGTTTWLAQSGIYRYATPLEAIGALTLVLVAQEARRWRSVALVAIALLASADTRRPHWGRDAGPEPLASLRAPDLGEGALVVTATDEPLAYLALGLPPDVPLLGLGNNFMQPERCTRLQQRASRTLQAWHGPLWLLETAAAPSVTSRAMLAGHYGLVATSCKDFANPLAGARLCRLERRGPARAPCLVTDGTRTGVPRQN